MFMSLSNSYFLIRDYNNIRQVLRDIYIFGCFSKEDFIKKGISARKYDNEKRRICSYLPEGFIKEKKINRKRIMYCSYKLEDSTKNYLAETYRNKSFTALDIMSYFFVLQILGDGREYAVSEILNQIPPQNSEVIVTNNNLRDKLEELVKNALIVSKKTGKNVTYSLSKDIWKNFSEEELKEIYTYLEFAKNVSPIGIPYYFLQRKLKLYMKMERNMDFSRKTIFQLKHNHLFNVLDNEIVLECLRAIKQKRKLRVRKKIETGENTFVTLPIKVIHDITYGRQYLMCFHSDLNQCVSIRLDQIIEAKCVEKLNKQEQQLIYQNSEIEKDCWCTSGMHLELQEVKIRFLFDEEKESFILNRIKKEGHGGTIEKEQDGQYLFKIKLRDPVEIVPWVRSFGERAKVISSGNYKIEQRIAEDWNKAVKKYETFSRNGKQVL